MVVSQRECKAIYGYFALNSEKQNRSIVMRWSDKIILIKLSNVVIKII